MSKARLVITAVITEDLSQGEVARAYGVSQVWVSRLVARYRAEGGAAFHHHRFRPHNNCSVWHGRPHRPARASAITAGLPRLSSTLRVVSSMEVRQPGV